MGLDFNSFCIRRRQARADVEVFIGEIAEEGDGGGDARDVGTSMNDGTVNGEGRRNDRGRARRAVAKSTRAGEAWGGAQALAGFSSIVAAANAKKRMDDFEEAKNFQTVRLETTAEGGFFGNLRDSGLKALPSILEFSTQSRAERERDEDAQRLRFGGVERLEIIGPDGKSFDLRKEGDCGV